MDIAGGEMNDDHHQQQQRQLLKAEIAVHPLYEPLLNAHVGCLRVATPIDHLPLIDSQLAQSHSLLRSYASQHRPFLSPQEKNDLDNFLVGLSQLSPLILSPISLIRLFLISLFNFSIFSFYFSLVSQSRVSLVSLSNFSI